MKKSFLSIPLIYILKILHIRYSSLNLFSIHQIRLKWYIKKMCNSSFVRHEENKEFRIEIKITTARSIEDDVVNVTWFKILYIFLWITLVSALLTAALLYFPYCAFNQTQLKSVNKFELFDDAAVKAVGTTILISLVSFIIQLLLVNSKYSKDIKKNEFGVRAIMFSLIGCFIGCVAFTFSHIDEKTSTDSTSVLLTEPVLVILVVVAKPTLQYGTEIVRNLEIAEDFFFNFVGVLAISVNFLHGKASSYGVLAAFFLLFHKIPYGRFRYFLLPKADWRKPKVIIFHYY